MPCFAVPDRATAFRFGIIGFLLGAYHPERLVAFEAARL
jgi:hypothetical protein